MQPGDDRRRRHHGGLRRRSSELRGRRARSSRRSTTSWAATGSVPPRRRVPPHPGRPCRHGPTPSAPRPTTSADKPVVWPTGAGGGAPARADGRRPRRSSADSDWPPTRCGCGGRASSRRCPPSRRSTGSTPALNSAVDLVRGLGVLTGIEVVDVEGMTGRIRHRLRRAARVRARRAGRRCGPVRHPHRGDRRSGSRRRCRREGAALERWDRLVLTELVAGLDELGPWRMLLLPDHATPLALRTHTSDPVPVPARRLGADRARAASTPNAASPTPRGPGHELMARLIAARPEHRSVPGSGWPDPRASRRLETGVDGCLPDGIGQYDGRVAHGGCLGRQRAVAATPPTSPSIPLRRGPVTPQQSWRGRLILAARHPLMRSPVLPRRGPVRPARPVHCGLDTASACDQRQPQSSRDRRDESERGCR